MMKKIFLLGIVVVISFFTFLFIKNDTFFHHIIQFERISKSIYYFTQNQVAQVVDSTITDITQISVPFHPQEHALTCETATLRMALNYYGENVTEEELLEKLNFDTKEPKTIFHIWGDPELGFVGDIDGSVFKGTGYGVYNIPILDLAMQYRPSFIPENAELGDILKEVKNGHPVIVWGLLSRRKPIFWRSMEGKLIEAYPGEHARVVMGFYGNISNPTRIILMDPIYGKIRMSKEKFLSDWNVMKRRTVVVH